MQEADALDDRGCRCNAGWRVTAAAVADGASANHCTARKLQACMHTACACAALQQGKDLDACRHG
jgi:hypothetical protein